MVLSLLSFSVKIKQKRVIIVYLHKAINSTRIYMKFTDMAIAIVPLILQDQFLIWFQNLLPQVMDCFDRLHPIESSDNHRNSLLLCHSPRRHEISPDRQGTALFPFVPITPFQTFL